MATQSSILAWRTPWTEEPRRLQSMGSHTVGHDWATKHPELSLSYLSVTWKMSPMCLKWNYMCKVPGHLRKMLLVPVISAGLLLSRWKSKNRVLKCSKCKNRTGWDWCHTNGWDWCQVLVRIKRLIRLTLTLTVPTKMIFRSFSR